METLPKNWTPDKYTNWYDISRYRKLSESFIRKYKDNVNWDCISYYQDLSESFIIEYKDNVNWGCISICQKHISHKILNKYQYRISGSWINKRRDHF